MQLTAVRIEKPEPVNFILGQTHFIKTVEDVHEALVDAVPGIKFGVAFCEASGKCLVRWSGTDPAMIELARKNAAGHRGRAHVRRLPRRRFYPVNVLNALKAVPEVCRIFCATANPTEVVVAATEQGRGILGVIDGSPPKGWRAMRTSPGAGICAQDRVQALGIRPRILHPPMLGPHTPSLRATPLGRGDFARRLRIPLWRGVPAKAGCVVTNLGV